MFEAEHWTVVRVYQGQQALNSCVHTALNMDTGKTSRQKSHILHSSQIVAVAAVTK